jgi:hypothetical protein
MSNSPPVVETRPLFFFQAQQLNIELSQNLRIRAISKLEKYPPEEDETGGWNEGCGWGLEKGYDSLFFVVDCLGASSSDTSREITRLAACLLMYKTDPTVSIEIPRFELSYWGRRANEYSGRLPSLNYGALEEINLLGQSGPLVLYLLGFQEQDPFLKFWTKMTSNVWTPNLMWAARRLLRAQHRVGEEQDDKLIDLVIALEALVLSKKERDKQKNLSSRAGRLQGLTGHLEKRAIDELFLAYDLRNDAVHDGLFSSANLSRVGGSDFLQRYITYIERYVRVGMRNYLEMANQGLSKDQIIQQLS